MGTSRPQYYVASGVRRSIAAREAGLVDILATILEAGKPDVLTRIPLDQLHSPRSVIPRDSRYLRVEIASRRGLPLPPIEVQLLGAPGQGKAVPLAHVLLQ